jgi:hypothetical protein
MNTESEPRKKRLCELVGEEVRRQENERGEDMAYADLSEAFDASNPGSTFAERITQRIQQRRFEQ